MEKEKIPAYFRDTINEATRSATAVYNLLDDVITPAFDCFTCEGLLNYDVERTGKSREQAALEWMEEHFDALLSACCAAEVLANRVIDILQMLPQEV